MTDIETGNLFLQERPSESHTYFNIITWGIIILLIIGGIVSFLVSFHMPKQEYVLFVESIVYFGIAGVLLIIWLIVTCLRCNI